MSSSTMIWTEQGQMLPGWEGPDHQDGTGYVRRFTYGGHAVVDVAFYAARSSTGGYDVWCETSRTVCRDITDPGSTEEWADATAACLVRGLRDPAVAHARAEAAARAFPALAIDWDGRPHR
jgi:hypothetical protein